jgi:alpha-beta hydrolase superfamily lysophospholipase
LSRYHAGSTPARLAFDQVYNRSFELEPEEVRGAALLVHGLSDSPYSLRAVAEFLHARGFYVLVLRLPGHGTVPAALLDVSWRDWRAAVAIAARQAAAKAPPGKPFYAGGYSTGAPLVLLHALDALEGGSARLPDRLLLFSPAIGISRFAVFTTLVSRLSFLPYFEQSAWLDVLPEYDPFKYNSFPVNAATQIYHLTRELEARLAAAQAGRQLERMPRVLAFQSLVDATVSAADVVNRLFLRLPAAGHELVVFDLNRGDRLRDLIAEGPQQAFNAMVGAPALPFRLTVITNRAPDTDEVASYTRAAGSRETAVTNLGLSWPQGVLSLAHVAIPFPPDDPLYGLLPAAGESWGLPLGRLAARGEAGAIVISLASLARLRSNPFFEVIRARVQEAVAGDLGR